MLERIIYLLNKVLEPYIGGIDHNKLHFNNLLSGKVVLNGLHLKPSIVDSLNLPFHLTFGLIDQVAIKIHLPILSFSKRKLVMEISDVIFLLTAVPESQWDPKAYREEYVAQKVATLAAESLQLVVKEMQGGGFLWKTFVSFLENLEVTVNNVHIRIEDYTTSADISYAIGCVIKSAVFLSEGADNSTANDEVKVDTPFRRAFYNEQGMLNPNTIHRNIKLNGVGVYIDRLDPLRAALMRSDQSMAPCSQTDAPMNEYAADGAGPLSSSYDYSKFTDAISHGSGSQNASYHEGSTSHIHCLARVLRRGRVRHIPYTKEKLSMKNYKFKNRRAGNSTRQRLRCMRYRLEKSGSEHVDAQARLTVLSPSSSAYGEVIQRVMDYLKSGKHSRDCESHEHNGWKQNYGATIYRDVQEERLQSTSFASCNSEDRLWEGSLGSVKRISHHQMYTRRPFNNSRYKRPAKRNQPHNLLHSRSVRCIPPKFVAKYPQPENESKAAHGWIDKEKKSASEEPESLPSNSLGYQLSSGSSWRVLLSTFCDIQQESGEYQQTAVDMIQQAQQRYQKRNMRRSTSMSDEDKDSCHGSNKCESSNEPDHSTAETMDFQMEPQNSTTKDPETSTEDMPSTEDKKCGFNICGGIDCTVDDLESDYFDEHAFNNDRNVPLSYHEAWHIYGRPPETVGHPESVTVADIADNVSEEGIPDVESVQVHQEDIPLRADVWTKFTFVMNNQADPSLKELFLRSIEETSHNYILNPKDFHGVASFYFCMYPTKAYVKPHSCWSSWGRKREFKFQKDRMSIAKEYLPQCSVFLAFQNLSIVLSKHQYDCLMNMIYENIFKYFNWQSGIIYTFESPRASREDEKTYMDYWPQYLLLGQNDKNNKLREFIKDFEILHSVQVIRILRSNASEALRKLLRRYGEGRDCGSCDVSMNECVTDVLFSNICNQFEDEGVTYQSGDDGSKLHARLRMVGGIYEIVTKHAGSTTFLDSLRKICQPSSLTLDFALDLTLVNSRLMFMFDTQLNDDSVARPKNYVLTSRGIHLFITDVYGRDGCQFIELELLPFSLVSFAVNVPRNDFRVHDTNGCACNLLDGPATLLLSCKDEDKAIFATADERSDQNHGLMPSLEKLKALKREIAMGITGKRNVKKISAEDSSVYLAMSFNRFCTADEADTRVLFHMNCDLFSHIRVLEEFKDIIRHRMYNQRHYKTQNPILVGKEKRQHHLENDKDGFYRECYELIDLGVEYSKNLVQGAIPFMNVEYDIEAINQIAVCVDLGTTLLQIPYFIILDSVTVTSEVTPRVLEPSEHPPYDTHLIRLANTRVCRVNGDYDFMVHNGKRNIYLDGPCSMMLNDYLDLVSRVKVTSIFDDVSVQGLLSQLPRNVEILRLGDENDAFIKIKLANSRFSNRDLASVVTTICLESVKVSIREMEMMYAITVYGDFSSTFEEYKDYTSYFNSRFPDRSHGSTCELAIKGANVTRSLQTQSFIDTASIGSNFMFYCDELMEFRSIVSKKWSSLQKRMRRKEREQVNHWRYELRVDYFYLEVRRPVNLECGNGGASEYIDISAYSEQNSVAYSPRSCPSFGASSSAMIMSPMKITDCNKVEAMSPSAIVSRRIASNHEEYRKRQLINEFQNNGTDHLMSRYMAICSMQDAIRNCGITLPLVSLKLTGIGAKVGISDRRVERMRVYIGCVEIEDQSNSVPLYLSTLLLGGDPITFWRWLKVRREVHLVSHWVESSRRQNVTYNRGSNNNVQRTAGDRSVINERQLRQRLKHIDGTSIQMDITLSHDYDEDAFFMLDHKDDAIVRSYKMVEKYLSDAMNYNVVMCHATDVDHSRLGKNPCFMTMCLNYDKSDNGQYTCNFSSTMVNIAWEVLDEVFKMANRVMEYASSIPPTITLTKSDPVKTPVTKIEHPANVRPSDCRWYIEATVNVDQSCLNVLCDSAWTGYSNFVRFMWYKLLRETFNITEALSSSNSRAGSIRESSDGQQHSIYISTKEQQQAHRNSNSPRSSIVMTRMHELDRYLKSLKTQGVEKTRDHIPQHVTKEVNKYPNQENAFVVGQLLNSRIRWKYLKSIFHEKYRKAYLSGPIYMRLSGCGTMSLTFCSQLKDHRVIKDQHSRAERSSSINQNRLILGRLFRNYYSYLPCALKSRISGRNISASFTRESTANVLSVCGFVFPGKVVQVGTSEAYQNCRLEFSKYIRPHIRRDHKHFGLIGLSKHTLFDPDEMIDSLFLEPFRLEITLASRVYGIDASSRKAQIYSVPQCFCVDIHFEAVKLSLNCADLLSFCNLIGLATGIVDRPKEGCQYPSNPRGMDSTYSYISIPTNFIEHQNSGRELSEDEKKGGTDFHSCQSSDSGSDWISVDSDTDEDRERLHHVVDDLKDDDSDISIQSMRTEEKPENQKEKLSLLEELLSFFSFGCRFSLDLLLIEISSNGQNNIKNVATLTIEDISSSLWSDKTEELLSRLVSRANNTTGPINDTVEDENFTKFREILTLSEYYLSEIDSRLSLSMAGIQNTLSTGKRNLMVEAIAKIGSSRDKTLVTDIAETSQRIFQSNEQKRHVLRFETHFFTTLDICNGTGQEMVIEPVKVCFRGFKRSVYSKTLSSLNTSWINLNVSLNGARCVYDFLKHFTELSKIRTAILETSSNDLLRFQPPPMCLLNTDVLRTMMPLSLINQGSNISKPSTNTPGCALTNPKVTLSELPDALCFRIKNNLIGSYGYFDVHGCLVASLHNISSLKMDATAQKSSGIGALTIGRASDAVSDGITKNGEDRSQHSYIYNNLGQPIAICTYMQAAHDNDKEQKWNVIEDGECLNLPMGYYGVLMPFVIRVQINNCIYEIPYSMLKLTQEEEFVIRLDISRRHNREMRIPRSGILNNIHHFRHKANAYKFGVPASCVHVVDRKQSQSSDERKDNNANRTRKSSRFSPSKWLRKLQPLNRTNRILTSSLEKSPRKYAYIMVRTVKHTGIQQSLVGSSANLVSIYLSSTLWLSNRSQEDLVVFPSAGIDQVNRVVDSTSLVWLFYPPPVTSSLPISPKAVESNKIISSVKSVGNTLFKQFSNIQESKQAIKKLAPAHILTLAKLNEEIEELVPEYMLQYVLLRASPYSQTEVAIPLSWTIAHGCSMAVALQEDFPVAVNVPNADILRRHEMNGSEIPPGMPARFTADTLLESSSMTYLYDSYEQPRVKTPIPDYIAKVHLGNLQPQDLLGSDMRTGFVQDIVNPPKAKEHTETRQSSLQHNGVIIPSSSRIEATDAEESKEWRNTTLVHRDAALQPGDATPCYDTISMTSALYQNQQEEPRCSIQSSESAPVVTMPDGTIVQQNTVPLKEAGSAHQNPDAYKVVSRQVARLTVNDPKASSTPSCSITLKRRKRFFNLRSASSRAASQTAQDEGGRCQHKENGAALPKSILSSTLIEVTLMSKSRLAMKSGRVGVKNYKITLENCHIIENMMPYDVHIISPLTYEHLNRAQSRSVETENGHPFFHPIMIKASDRTQFSWYMRNGRFVMKELVSREFTVKMPTETVSVSSLVLDSMQPTFMEEFCQLAESVGIDTSDFTAGSLPRRLVVSIETSKKPVDPINDRNGVVNRFLASSQIVYTIYSEKWILSWLNYPISLCRGDARYKQTIAPESCTLVSHDMSSTSLQLAIRKSTLKQVPNFENYPKLERRLFFTFEKLGETHVMSKTFTLPNFSFSTCDFNSTMDCPRLHYVVSSSMAPAPFFRTSVLEILPQTTLTNEFGHPLWLREMEPHQTINFVAKKACCGWYLIEPGVTLEFHSQTKGDIIVEITGIDPETVGKAAISRSVFQSSSAFNFWSCGIGLKASNVAQFRYPSALRALRQPISAGSNPGKPLNQGIKKHRKNHVNYAAARSVRYSLCEVEIRVHRGAKMVRFMKPTTADWVILNTTGVDLWIEQYGVPGYGELIPAIDTEGTMLTEDYAGRGVRFAYYDPFKEHKLVCRIHPTSAMFKTMNGQHGKNSSMKNDNIMGTNRWDRSIALLNSIPLGDVIKKQTGRLFRMKGSLLINLSCVESRKFSSVFQIKCGTVTISIRLTAKTTVIFGQKTLHFTAAITPFRLLPRLQKIRPTNLWNIYSQLKNKLNVPKNMAYPGDKSGANSGAMMNNGIVDFVTSKLSMRRNIKVHGKKASRYVENVLASSPYSTHVNPKSSVVAGLRRRRDRSRKGTLFNWEYLFQFNVLGLGTAICGGITEEMLYVSATLVKFMITMEKGGYNYSLTLGWIQSDVHDPRTCYPTMLRPLTSWHSMINMNETKDKAHRANNAADGSAEDNKKEPRVLTIKFNTLSNKYFSVKEITNCRIELEPLSLNLDTRIGHSILVLVDEYMSVFGFSGMTSDYFSTANVGIFSNVDTWLQNFDVAQYHLQEVARSQFSSGIGSGTRYNISNLYVGKITLTINIRRSVSRSSPDMEPENLIIRYLTNIVRRTPHISDANIILGQESLLELCCTPYALMSHFLNRYVTQSVQQIYKVLGAVDLIGNPKIVLHHWISGFRNAMSHLRSSLQYLHVPPIMVFYWLQAASQLGAAFIIGIVDASYRLTGSWYLLFNTLACNADSYAVVIMHDTFRNSIEQPSNIVEGVIFGGRSFGRNLYTSLGNFALKPLNQMMRVFNSIKAAKTINTDVLFTGLHVFGSMFSSMASLTFGTISSVLSGISVISQGILNQINSVPMLSEIRPQRSPKTLKNTGPILYSFLESWSMNATRQVKYVDELMILLPMDSRTHLFDPVYATTLHWSALSEHMGKISPITICRSSTTLPTFFWISCKEIGFVVKRKLIWRCENSNICSIEIFKVPVTSHQHVNHICYDDSIVVNMQPKVIKKHCSHQDSYYMRIIHMGSNVMQSRSTGNLRIPLPLYKRFKDESTFPTEAGVADYIQGMVNMQLVQEESDLRMSLSSPNHNRTRSSFTSVQRLYHDSVGSLDLAMASAKDRPAEQKVKIEMETRNPAIASPKDEVMTERPGEGSSSLESTALNERGLGGPELIHVRAVDNSRLNQAGKITKVAEVIRLPDQETARLYFSLIVSVLKEAAL